MDIQEVRKRLPRGSVSKIAKQTRIRQQHVSAILLGRIKDSKFHKKVLDAAIRILEARLAQERKAEQVMKDLEPLIVNLEPVRPRKKA